MSKPSQDVSGEALVGQIDVAGLERILDSGEKDWVALKSKRSIDSRSKKNREFYKGNVSGYLKEFVFDVNKDAVIGGNILYRNARLRAKNASAVLPELSVEGFDDTSQDKQVVSKIRDVLVEYMDNPSSKKLLADGLLSQMMDFIAVAKVFPSNGKLTTQLIPLEDIIVDPGGSYMVNRPTTEGFTYMGNYIRNAEFQVIAAKYPKVKELVALTAEGEYPLRITYKEVFMTTYDAPGS